MNTTAITAHSSSLFEIDAELEAAFEQLQEEREISGYNNAAGQPSSASMT